MRHPVRLALIVIAVMVATGLGAMYIAGAGTRAVPPSPPTGLMQPAPIDGLEVRTAESMPPQYFLYIKAGLPSGCARQGTHEMTRSGDVIKVEVLNHVEGEVCTTIYGMYELNIALGSDFTPGTTYAVLVNDKKTSFTAR